MFMKNIAIIWESMIQSADIKKTEFSICLFTKPVMIIYKAYTLRTVPKNFFLFQYIYIYNGYTYTDAVLSLSFIIILGNRSRL